MTDELELSAKKEDRFYWALMAVLRNNGHSRDRAREIYLEIHEAVRDLIVTHEELHIQGLLTVRFRFKMESTIDGFTRLTSAEPHWVVRATVTVRRALRALLTEHHADHR